MTAAVGLLGSPMLMLFVGESCGVVLEPWPLPCAEKPEPAPEEEEAERTELERLARETAGAPAAVAVAEEGEAGRKDGCGGRLDDVELDPVPVPVPVPEPEVEVGPGMVMETAGGGGPILVGEAGSECCGVRGCVVLA